MSSLSDEDKDALKQWFQNGQPRTITPPADIPARSASPAASEPAPSKPLPPWVQGPWDATKGALEGAAKEGVGALLPPMTEASKNDPWLSFGGAREWAASDDPNHPNSEWVGRGAADILPLMALPEADIYGAGARALNAAGKLPLLRYAQKPLRGLDWLANRAYQGAVGGAMEDQKDVGRGAAEGAGGSVLGAPATWALGKVGRPVAAGLAGAAHMMGGHLPGAWATYHAMHPLTSLAQWLSQQQRLSGPTGAASAAASRYMGYEDDQGK